MERKTEAFRRNVFPFELRSELVKEGGCLGLGAESLHTVDPISEEAPHTHFFPSN